jgi:hypothetical protein
MSLYSCKNFEKSILTLLCRELLTDLVTYTWCIWCPHFFFFLNTMSIKECCYVPFRKIQLQEKSWLQDAFLTVYLGSVPSISDNCKLYERLNSYVYFSIFINK